MQLVTHTQLNSRFFSKGSRPSRTDWIGAIERGEVNGKVVLNKVFIDVDDFLSKDFFEAVNEPKEEEEDLLHG